MPRIAPQTERPLARGARIFLARHGVTAANVRRIRAPDAEPLLPEGRRQARLLADAITALAIPIEGIWTSPTPRARETARVVAQCLGVPLRMEPLLQDLAERCWEGMDDSQIARAYPDEHTLWQTRPTSLRLDGHETLDALAARALPCLERMLSHGNLLAITHLGPLRVAWARAAGLPLEAFGTVTPDHCELYELQVKVDRRWRMRALNSP